MKTLRTLVLLADDARVRLFEAIMPGKGFTEIEDMTSGPLAGGDLAYSDRPGRNAAAPGMARHGLGEAQDVDALERRAFARDLLAETEALFAARGYDRFVLVAAPVMLGELRAALPRRLREALVDELAKDYLNLKPQEIARRLEERDLFAMGVM